MATEARPHLLSYCRDGMRRSTAHAGRRRERAACAEARSVLPGRDAPADGRGDPYRRLGGSSTDAFNRALAHSVLHALWLPAGMPDSVRDGRVSAALAVLAGFGPRDEVEGMLAAQAVALHAAAMECFRRAMLPEQPAEIASKFRRDGANLARAMVEMAEAIERHRGKGPKQVVRVERVVVQEGGQAIVGAVSAAKVPPQGGAGGGDG
jgi:hypothetical protein